MKFTSRIIVIVCWMLSISLSSLAVTKMCGKKNTVVLQGAFKQAKKTNNDYPVNDSQSLVKCSAGITWNITKEEVVILQRLASKPAYKFFTSPFICNLTKNPPYAPPRYVLNS